MPTLFFSPTRSGVKEKKRERGKKERKKEKKEENATGSVLSSRPLAAIQYQLSPSPSPHPPALSLNR
jgi:hypothetical protein